MHTLEELQEALRFFSKIAQDEDVPVGITVSMDGNFGIRRSLTSGVQFLGCLDHAAMRIIDEYKQMAGLVYKFEPILRSDGIVARNDEGERYSVIRKAMNLF